MIVPKEISSHHTVWVRPRDGYGPAVPARYATSGEHVYCFGDDVLAEVLDGERVAATVHRIANGPPLFGFSATVRTVVPDKVDAEVLNELLTHVPLGRTLSEVQHSLDDQRQRRRVVELVA
jgi:hypothetical protein